MRFNDTARSKQHTGATFGGQKPDRDDPWVKRTSGQPILGRTAHRSPVSGLVVLQYIFEIANCSLDSENISVFPGMVKSGGPVLHGPLVAHYLKKMGSGQTTGQSSRGAN